MNKTVIFCFLTAFLSPMLLVAAASSVDVGQGSKVRVGSLVLRGHEAQVTSVAWSSDNKTVASGSWDNTVRIWNAQTGECLHILQGHTSGITTVVCNPKDDTIASGSWDDTIRIWSIKSGECLRTIKTNTHGVLSLAYLPNGRAIFSGSNNGTICMWNAQTGKLGRSMSRDVAQRSFCERGIVALVCLPDGRNIVSVSKNNEICRWGIAACKPTAIDVHETNWISSLVMSTSSEDLVFPSCADIILKKLNGSGVIKRLSGHADVVSSVAINSTGQTLASASFDKTIRIWDIKTGDCLNVLRGHESWVSSIAYSLDGSTLASGSHDRTVRIWFDVEK